VKRPSSRGAQGLQNPKLFPSAFDGVHVEPAAVQSAAFSQTVMPGAGHEAAHVVPVKPVHSAQVTPHELAVVGEPVPQQTGPAELVAQSMASRHCQSTEPVTGHAVPIATQVDSAEDPSGVSQQCWPAVHVMLEDAPLNGQ
jgi:hypothetical protein